MQVASNLIDDLINDGSEGIDENPFDDEFEKRLKEFDKLLDNLSNITIGSDLEKIEESYIRISEYVKTYRFLYSSVYRFLYEKDVMCRETLNENIKTIYKYKLNDDTIDISPIEKLYDYTNLSLMQRNNIIEIQENIGEINNISNDIKNSLNDANYKINTLDDKYKEYKTDLENYKKSLEKDKSEFYNSLIGLIAMFISVAFVIFGGISGLSGLSEPLREVVKTGENSIILYRSIIIWSLGLFNLLSLVMFFISKFLNNKINIKLLYIVSNIVLIVMFIISLFF